jgi:membrane protease YdiL (CAAX protease family)
VAAIIRTLVVVLLAAACSRPVVPARTSPMQPASVAEEAAVTRRLEQRCSYKWGLLFPGLSQYCSGRDTEALILGGLGAAELAVGIAAGEKVGYEHPASAIPILAFTDLWLYSYVDGVIDRQRADYALYAPQDSLADLVAAPFNIQVLKRADVWLGTAAFLAAGIAVSMLVDEQGVSTDRLGDDPNIFGETMDPELGYPLAVATGVGLFQHVAIAEEVAFRGALQSGIARQSGENRGHLWASVIFGLAHAPNALLLEPEDRARYLLVGLPFLTAAGGFLGWVYRRADYSLAPPVAVHFWYDLLLSATFFALDPQNSPISARISIPF